MIEPKGLGNGTRLHCDGEACPRFYTPRGRVILDDPWLLRELAGGRGWVSGQTGAGAMLDACPDHVSEVFS